MKKGILALFITTIIISIPSVVFAETSIVGGWSLPDSLFIPEEAKAIYNQAVDEIDVEYEPIALLGTQVVAGTNYCFLCKNIDTGYALIYIQHKPDGSTALIEKNELYIGLKEETNEEVEAEAIGETDRHRN